MAANIFNKSRHIALARNHVAHKLISVGIDKLNIFADAYAYLLKIVSAHKIAQPRKTLGQHSVYLSARIVCTHLNHLKRFLNYRYEHVQFIMTACLQRAKSIHASLIRALFLSAQ